MSNKIKYGLKNVHYAKITVADGEVTYGTPVRIPGGVALSVSPKGDKSEFYADDTLYFSTTANQGYEGTLEIALLPDHFKKDILLEELDSEGVQFERSDVIPGSFALLFEFSGDVHQVRHCLYNCTVARPNIESQTKSGTLEVKTETLNITAAPGADSRVKASVTNAESTKVAYDAWYAKVHTYKESAE